MPGQTLAPLSHYMFGETKKIWFHRHLSWKTYRLRE